MKKYYFSHVGKGGGSTMEDRVKSWQLRSEINLCHPHPCLDMAHANITGLLINIRDPVDRFRSAVDWRSMVVCNGTTDPRYKNASYTGKKLGPHWEWHCKVCGFLLSFSAF